MTGRANSFVAGVLLAALAATPASTLQNIARERAIRHCNALSSPYVLYTWGNWQLYLYRACMAGKHQQE